MNDELIEQPNAEPNADALAIQANLRRLARIRKHVERGTLYIVAPVGLHLLLDTQIHDELWRHFLTNVYFAVVMLYVGFMAFLRGQYNKTSAFLYNLDDVTDLGPLLDGLSLQQVGLPPALKRAVINLLSQVQASDAPLLNANHRRKLYTLLTPGGRGRTKNYDRSVAGAVLGALEQVGDYRAIPHVERVARNSKDAALRDAAEHCLVFLRQRAEQQKVADTLLRPSDANTAAPDTLLRATVARPDEQPATLLRANAAPDEPNA